MSVKRIWRKKPNTIDWEPCVDDKQSKSLSYGLFLEDTEEHIVDMDVIGPITPLVHTVYSFAAWKNDVFTITDNVGYAKLTVTIMSDSYWTVANVVSAHTTVVTNMVINFKFSIFITSKFILKIIDTDTAAEAFAIQNRIKFSRKNRASFFFRRRGFGRTEHSKTDPKTCWLYKKWWYNV